MFRKQKNAKPRTQYLLFSRVFIKQKNGELKSQKHLGKNMIWNFTENCLGYSTKTDLCFFFFRDRWHSKYLMSKE